MRFKRIGFLLAITALFAGCAAPPGVNPVEQTAGQVTSATMGTSRLVRVLDPDEVENGIVTKTGKSSLYIDTNLPTFSSQLDFTPGMVTVDGKETQVWFPRVNSTGGGASHEMFVPFGPQRWGAIRSSTVVSVEAAKYRSNADGSVEIDGLKIGSDAAAANVSVAAVADSLAPTWAKWSDDERQKYETFVKEQTRLGIAGFDTLSKAIDLLKTRAVPIP